MPKELNFLLNHYLWLNILASKTINMLFAKNYQKWKKISVKKYLCIDKLLSEMACHIILHYFINCKQKQIINANLV